MSEEERIDFEVAAGADPGFMKSRYGDRARQKAQNYWDAKRAQGWRLVSPEDYPRYQRILVPQGYAPDQVGYGIDSMGLHPYLGGVRLDLTPGTDEHYAMRIAAEERARYLKDCPPEPQPRQELNRMKIIPQRGHPRSGGPRYGYPQPEDPRYAALGYDHPRYTDP